MNGFLEVARIISEHCGIPNESIFASGKKRLTLPGYFRPNKAWDFIVIHHQRLIAALEFKSQAGSFGNNFNNRSEEVIGSASDLRVAIQKGALRPENHKLNHGPVLSDPRPPFLGYLMLLEDCSDATKTVRADSYHYNIFPEFAHTSYADRYRLLCERLMEQKLYDSAALVVSSETEGSSRGHWRSLSPATDARNFFTELAARLHAAAQSR